MTGNELTLVLSGHLCRPHSADLRPFWRGFIELQKKLPSSKPVHQVVVHSWNPELADLAQVVYAPQVACHEHQGCFYPEFIQRIDPPDRFELGVDRLNSTWKNVSIQSVLGNARARSRAVQLMEKLPVAEGQVLITRWDLGQTGSSQVNQLVADASLPEEYLYLSYFSEVDEGYADMWLLAPWELARRFGSFDEFVLESLAGGNGYLESFSATGWPRARSKTRYQVWLSHPIGQRAHVLVSRILQALQYRSQGAALLQRVVRRLIAPVQRFLAQPPLTAENSCSPCAEAKPHVFPAFLALNIHALLKYFILSVGLRERTRFISYEDFAIEAQSGQLLNPQPIVLIIGDSDEAAVARLLAESPLPFVAIYQLTDTAVREHVPEGQGKWESRLLQAKSNTPRGQMDCALAAASSHFGDVNSLLIMPTVERFLGCADWFYLNALAKFIAWRQIGYVGLDCVGRGRPHLEFPDVEMVRGSGAFSLAMAAGTVAGVRAFLDSTDGELVDLCDRAERMQLEFPVVVKSRKLF